MKKGFFLGTLFSIILIAVSCQNNVLEECELKSEIQASNLLSEKEVMNIVSSFYITIEGKTLQSRASALDAPVIEAVKKMYVSPNARTTRSPHDTNAPIYVVNIINGTTKGKALVSGDKRFPNVLAYIPLHNDSLNNVITASAAMSQMAINTYLENLGSSETEEITRSTPITEVERPLMILGPLCRTEWDQFEPYNLAYPKNWIDLLFGYCTYGHYPTGCAVTAIAQILAVIEPNMTCAGLKRDWGYLKEYKIINNGPFGTPDPQRKLDMVAALFKDIYDKTSSYPLWGIGETDEYPSQQVSCVTSVATNASNVYNYLNSNSGVTYCNNFQKWDINAIISSLRMTHPIFVGGNNHAFAIDGYVMNENTSGSYNTYLHSCFGWGGYGDGYYLVNSNGSISFETGSGTYTDTQLSIITNIRKR